jgi:hypothetical protein
VYICGAEWDSWIYIFNLNGERARARKLAREHLLLFFSGYERAIGLYEAGSLFALSRVSRRRRAVGAKLKQDALAANHLPFVSAQQILIRVCANKKLQTASRAKEQNL